MFVRHNILKWNYHDSNNFLLGITKVFLILIPILKQTPISWVTVVCLALNSNSTSIPQGTFASSVQLVLKLCQQLHIAGKFNSCASVLNAKDTFCIDKLVRMNNECQRDKTFLLHLSFHSQTVRCLSQFCK